MQQRWWSAASALIFCGGVALAQAPPPSQAANPQAAPASGQLNMQLLAEMLRSASTFHDLVENLNVGKSLGPDQHVVGPDGQLHHSLDRTAQTVGAGAGAGAAIGAMTHRPNGVLIGALIGAGSGMILDQILKDREQKAKAATLPAPDVRDAPQRRPPDANRKFSPGLNRP